jgi:hypothetical protein
MHRFDDVVRVREFAGLEFGIDQLATDDDLKTAAARRDEFQGTDTFLERKEFGRQTDGLRLVVSKGAILNADVQAHKNPSGAP